MLDLALRFWQIPLDPATKHKTAFITCYGNYQFRRLPFGTMNAPATFQAVMASVLHSLQFKMALMCVDDVIIFSRDLSPHLQNLDMVFQRLRKANLKLKPSKCKFACPRVLYLGHIITRAGIEVDLEKTDAVDSYATPKTQRQLRSFLGLCNYYRRFVQWYAATAAPLNAVLRKDAKFSWTNDCQT